MICPQCSHWISAPNKVCPHCGYNAVPTPQQVAPPQPQQVAPDPFGIPNPPTYPGYSPAPVPSTPSPVEMQQPEKKVLTPKEWFILAAFLLGLVALVFAFRFVIAHPYISLGVFLFVCMVVGSMPQKCYVCKNPLSKHVFNWDLDGRKRRVCSHCNQSLQRKNSRDAMRERNAR